VVALTGRDGGEVPGQLGADDIEFGDAHSTARIQEIHILIVHCLCDLIDCQLLDPES
jgi:D-sedoheptulose 7-phosphate isomerase